MKELLKSLGIHKDNHGAYVGAGNWSITTNAGVLNSNVIGQVKGSAMQFVGGYLPYFSLLGNSIFNNIVFVVDNLGSYDYSFGLQCNERSR